MYKNHAVPPTATAPPHGDRKGRPYYTRDMGLAPALAASPLRLYM